MAEKLTNLTQPITPNPITVNGTVKLANYNADRKRLTIQNISAAVVFLGFGFTPNATNYSRALSAGTLADDGTGGLLDQFDSVFVGEVWAFATAGKVALTEFE